MPATGIDISIIICCYNSALRLAPTLKHIAAQVNSNVLFEIIIVDNASNDNTVEVANREIVNNNIQSISKIVSEPNPGLSSARKKGVSEARGKYVLFCDDDNWLADDYLNVAVGIMESNAKIGMLGGIGEAVIEGEKPEWFDEYQNAYAVGPQHTEAADISQIYSYVYGAGAVVRKQPLQILEQIGFEHVLTDRIGKKMVSGGDNEMGYALVLLGYKIYYTPDLKFKHFIPESRATVEYLTKVRSARAYTTPVVNAYEQYIRFGAFSHDEPKLSDSYRNLKSLIKLYLRKLTGKAGAMEYSLRSKKIINLINYELFYRTVHRKNLLKVQRNIQLINDFKKADNAKG